MLCAGNRSEWYKGKTIRTVTKQSRGQNNGVLNSNGYGGCSFDILKKMLKVVEQGLLIDLTWDVRKEVSRVMVPRALDWAVEEWGCCAGMRKKHIRGFGEDQQLTFGVVRLWSIPTTHIEISGKYLEIQVWDSGVEIYFGNYETSIFHNAFG